MKIRAVLLDDEQVALDNLNFLLKQYCRDVEVIASFNSPKAAFHRLPELDFNLLFLDIEMPEWSGFDFLDQLKTIDFQVIFVTSYNQYALKAIRYSALDYILKPVDIDELVEAVKRASVKIATELPVQPLLDHANSIGRQEQLDKLALPVKSGYLFVPIESIILLEADGRYTRIHYGDQKEELVSIHLKEFEDMLEGGRFFRIHHRYLINLKCMLSYTKTDGGIVELEGGQTVPVSRRRKALFEKVLKNWIPGSK